MDGAVEPVDPADPVEALGPDDPESPDEPAVDAAPDVPQPELLLAPRDGLPPVIDADHPLDEAIRALAAGTGPVAVDAERASGYRYGQRAYLVQLRREGAGTFLVDPAACSDLSGLSQALAGVEWVLHAASQDLPCLAERGFEPDRLFDTELAARLAGHERVGLGTIIEKLLGYRLEKGHSAVDWSTRPLPEPWLRYAALDVELLVDLRDALEDDLRAQGKLEWALEEFAAIVDAPPKPPPAEPWRRTSGMHKVRNRRQLAVVRSLWQTRDRIAQRRDIAPGRILPDSAIVEAALAQPADQTALSKLPVYSGPRMRRTVEQWWLAIAEANALAEDELPRAAGPGVGLPPANRWADRDPEAAERLARARAGLASLSEQYRVPVENLLEPALVRRLAWAPPAEPDADSVRAFLTEGLARRWQIELTVPVLVEALALQDSPV
ncbi:MAG: ribonuclease [Frankiaceae bacterium]|nr:ribonuclease [Frankiaceae bacterium]